MKRLLCVVGVLFWQSASADSRDLAFYHTHTGKSLHVTYQKDGAYQKEALVEIEEFLKDFRNGERHPIDPTLLDILYEIKTQTGTQAPFEVISAYRSPATNEMLRTNSSGVAEKSMHLEGQAIDVRLRDVDLDRLRAVALRLERGGVGFYPGSNFVHVDTGRVRRW
jgi:uncharacterized protein YcbK (DUF882 family)